MVYYAGHGMEIGGVNYLIPTDAKLVADSDAETQAVALEQVIAAVSGARKLRLVLLDACRNNPFEQKMQRTMAVKLVSKGLSNIEPEAGFMVVYAAKAGETALDGDTTNSPFATALARDIMEPKVEVRKLFDVVRDDVWKATGASSSRSPTARCRAGRIFILSRGSDVSCPARGQRSRRWSAGARPQSCAIATPASSSASLRCFASPRNAARSTHTTTESRFAARVIPV